jgi:preprotein translocase subunit SecY
MAQPKAPPGSATGIEFSAEWLRAASFALGVLAITRMGIFIPLPGLDTETLRTLPMQSSGAWGRLGIFALGLTPFVTAWAIMEIFKGRRSEDRNEQIRRWITLAFALFQGWGVASALEGVRHLVPEPGFGFRFTVMITLATGTMLLLWLGEQITRTGFCDGVWLIVASSAISELPGTIAGLLHLNRAGEFGLGPLLATGAAAAILVALICLIELARRYVPTSVRGTGVPATTQVTLPLKVDNATILPAYIGGLLIGLPAAFGVDFGTGLPGYVVASTVVILLSTYLVTAARISPRTIADDLSRQNRLVAGTPTSNQSASEIARILSRLSFLNGLYLTAIFVAPALLLYALSLPVLVGGANLMIVVIVMLDILSRARRPLPPVVTTPPG